MILSVKEFRQNANVNAYHLFVLSIQLENRAGNQLFQIIQNERGKFYGIQTEYRARNMEKHG